jgi:hypothetical protein
VVSGRAIRQGNEEESCWKDTPLRLTVCSTSSHTSFCLFRLSFSLFNLYYFDEPTQPAVTMTESRTRCASRGVFPPKPLKHQRRMLLNRANIHTHMRSTLSNLGVSSRSAATRFALEQQLLRAKNLPPKDGYARLETSLHGYTPRLSVAQASIDTDALMLDEIQRRVFGSGRLPHRP